MKTLVFLLLAVANADAKVFSACEWARTLKANGMGGVGGASLADWVCVTYHESRYNTAAVYRGNSDGSADYGIFQINSRYWCNNGGVSEANGCGITCDGAAAKAVLILRHYLPGFYRQFIMHRSLSYVTCMGFFSFLLLGGMYFIIDVKGWWSGRPFIYPGMNSILVYVGHSLLGFYFPFSWEMRFLDSHWEWLFQSLWGTALWVLIAYLLYRKKFFLKI